MKIWTSFASACVILAVWGFALVACGGGAPEGSTAARPPADPGPSAQEAFQLDASAILTKADAAEVLGKAVKDPQVSGVGTTVTSCSYIADDLSGIGCLVRQSGSSDGAFALFDRALAQSKTLSSVDPVPIHGLGDRAYWAGGRLNQLNVLKGRYWVIISVYSGGKDALELAERAAARAVARLP